MIPWSGKKGFWSSTTYKPHPFVHVAPGHWKQCQLVVAATGRGFLQDAAAGLLSSTMQSQVNKARNLIANVSFIQYVVVTYLHTVTITRGENQTGSSENQLKSNFLMGKVSSQEGIILNPPMPPGQNHWYHQGMSLWVSTRFSCVSIEKKDLSLAIRKDDMYEYIMIYIKLNRYK